LLLANDGQPLAAFGASVALSTDWAAVGAPNQDGVGAVYLFARTVDGWQQRAKISASDGANGDLFGAAVAISSDRLFRWRS
jgi:hypothetical protein